MTATEALILGIVQGLTEFLPVSSSGHLQLVQYFLGMGNLDDNVLFSLVCHLGTLVATVVLLFKQIGTLFKTDHARLTQLLIATCPLFPLALFMKPIKAAYTDLSLLGYFFLVTSGILFLGLSFGKSPSGQDKDHKRWKDAFVIGCWQALAILPGISRSGATISGARLLGWSPREAVLFSFLLAIPTIVGGVLLECLHLARTSAAWDASLALPYFIGFSSSLAVGLCAFQLLLKLAYKNFSYFAWYCLILGLATTFFFLYI